jgi:hypothetical protein
MQLAGTRHGRSDGIGRWRGLSVRCARCSLERRLQPAHIGRFKPLRYFDRNWPKRYDRTAVETFPC